MTAVIRPVTGRRDNGPGTNVNATKPTVLHPKNPERICWGCDKLCPADSLACGNGTIRTLHPVELFGEDWLEWISERETGKPLRK